jgi:hypothetical protein
MRLENTHAQSCPADPRATLCETKYFGLRPQPLERFIYRLNLSRSAERVYWLHWDVGVRNRTFCSEIPISRAAQELNLDESSVIRAYQTLKAQGLIRRQDPGRDPANPFRRLTAVTEVLLPRAGLPELLNAPDRTSKREAISGSADAVAPSSPVVEAAEPAAPATTSTSSPPESTASAGQATDESAAASPIAQEPPPPPPKPGSMKIVFRAIGKLSPSERSRYNAVTADEIPTFEFDADTALSAEEQEALSGMVRRAQFDRRQNAGKPSGPAPSPAARAAPHSGPRVLDVFRLADLRKRLCEVIPLAEVPERLREITWSIERGALLKLEVKLAMNVAIKKVREKLWTRPNRMPPNWQLAQQR